MAEQFEALSFAMRRLLHDAATELRLYDFAGYLSDNRWARELFRIAVIAIMAGILVSEVTCRHHEAFLP